MARQSTLPDWLLADLAPMLRLATTLAGSTRGGAELATTALTTDSSWQHADEGYDLTPRLRTTLVRTFLASPLGRSRPSAAATGLDALTGPVRTAVVLRDGERLTRGEIATVMDRPGRRVSDELAAIPPGSHDAEIAQLAVLAPDPTAVAGLFPAATRTLARRRRTRTALLAVTAVAVSTAVAVPTAILPRLPHEARPAGQWRYSHEVRLADGWQINYRSITEDSEQTMLAVPWPGDDPITCVVTVSVVGVEPQLDGRLSTTTVDGRPGFLVEQPGNSLSLLWRFADDAWADVECPAAAPTEAVLRDVAARVRFEDNRQLLPVTLTRLPDQYRIRMVGASGTDTPNRDYTVVLEPPANSDLPELVVGPHTATTVDYPTSTIERCLDEAGIVCVSAAQSDDQIPVSLSLQRQMLAETIDDVRLAADPADQATWIDAISLPNP